MTSLAMIAGMLPVALGLGESGQQTAPLRRSLVGGLAAATIATLFILPSVFAMLQGRASTSSPSLSPSDADSPYFEPPGEKAAKSTSPAPTTEITHGS